MITRTIIYIASIIVLLAIASYCTFLVYNQPADKAEDVPKKTDENLTAKRLIRILEGLRQEATLKSAVVLGASMGGNNRNELDGATSKVVLAAIIGQIRDAKAGPIPMHRNLPVHTLKASATSDTGETMNCTIELYNCVDVICPTENESQRFYVTAESLHEVGSMLRKYSPR